MDYKLIIKKEMKAILGSAISEDQIVVEYPKDRTMGDYAVPCFTYAKTMRKSPNDIASHIKENLDKTRYENIEVVNGYLNLFINKKEMTKTLLQTILTQKENYSNGDHGKGKTVVMDYSSPNIAKPFGVGHLRSTVIGNSLKKIYEKNGYKVVAINHLGDWGTQFGKLVYAYKKWGNEEEVKKNPIDELKRLYVKFHDEATLNPELEEEGRKSFKELEDGNQEAIQIWNWFKEESLVEFQKTYDLLGVSRFDAYIGESFYVDKTPAIIETLEQKGLLEESEGARIVRLGDDMAPALIQKTDGATLYMTRELAAVLYRKNEFHFDKALYVVGNEQTLHFNQLKEVLKKMGYQWYQDVQHISFGMILQDGKKMSTRQGKSVKLHDVLLEAIALANQYIEERSPTLENKEEVSKKIGVGAVIFNDLKNFRTSDIEFNLEEILKFEGETGPYIQYTYARIQSLLNKKENIEINYDKIAINEYIWNVIFKMNQLKETIQRAEEKYDPSEIAKYVIDLSRDFNKLYANEKFVDGNKELTEFRLQVAEAVGIVLKESMNLLGIDVIQKM